MAPEMVIFTTGRDLASARAWTAPTAAGSGMTANWTVVAVGRPVTSADRSLGPMSLMEASGICRPAGVPHQQQLCGKDMQHDGGRKLHVSLAQSHQPATTSRQRWSHSSTCSTNGLRQTTLERS